MKKMLLDHLPDITHNPLACDHRGYNTFEEVYHSNVWGGHMEVYHSNVWGGHMEGRNAMFSQMKLMTLIMPYHVDLGLDAAIV